LFRASGSYGMIFFYTKSSVRQDYTCRCIVREKSERGLRNFRGEYYGLAIFGWLFHGRGVAECVVVVSRASVHRTRFQMAG